MKIKLRCALLALTIAVAGCGDNKQKKIDLTNRHITTAQAYQQQGQFRAAMIEARNAISSAPENPQPVALLAAIYNEIGAYSTTIALLEKQASTRGEDQVLLAEAYIGNKKYTSAQQFLTSAQQANHPAPIAIRLAELMAQAAIFSGDAEASSKALAHLKTLAPESAELKFLQASEQALKGELTAAKDQLEQLLANNPQHVNAWIHLGNLAALDKNLARAEEAYSKALALLPATDIITAQKTQVLAQLAEVLTQSGRMSEAYRYQKLLAEANPESSAAQQKFNEALAFYQQGKFNEAEALLNELRAQFPQEKNTATLLGMVELQQGTSQAAGQLFDQFVDPETAAPSILQAAAVVKYRSNKVDEALALLKKAAEGQPSNPGILATYGLALLDRDPKSNEGANLLEKSLALDANQQRLRLILARHKQSLNQPQQALAQLQKAFAGLPGDLMIQQSYFKALFEAQLAEPLKAAISQLQSQESDASRGWFWQGWYEVQLQDYAAAEKSFTKALQIPNNQNKHLAYSGLGQVYEMQKNYPKAIAHWQLALQADPTLASGYSHLLGIAQLTQQTEPVLVFLEALSKEVKSWQPDAVLAQIYVKRRDLNRAITHAQAALEKSANALSVKQFTAQLYQLRSAELRVANKPVEAKASLLQALKLAPDNTDYLADLIESELADKHIEEAQQLLDQLAKTEDTKAANFYLQGLIRMAEGKTEEAFKLYRLSWAQFPSEKAATAMLNYYRQQQQETAAAAFVDEWLGKQPNNPRALLLKAVAEQQNQRLPEAALLYEKILQLSPNSLVALNNLAWLYHQQSDKRALGLAKRAAELAPESAEVLDTYGWLLAAEGDVSQALVLLEKAAALAPGNKEISEHLKAVKQPK